MVDEVANAEATLGVDPRLVLVFETNRAIPPDEFRPAELQVLDASTESMVVAFADDPTLAAFLERLGTYGRGAVGSQQSPSYQGFFDGIDRVRRYGPEDRLSPRLQSRLRELTANETLAVDIECWFPDSAAQAEEWQQEVAQAATSQNGQIVDSYLNPSARVALVRVEAPVSVVQQMASLDVVATMDLPPEPLVWVHEAVQLAADDLPDVPAPPTDAPLVGVVDSGVRSAHPLLAGCVHDAVSLTAFADGQDTDGHGTAVASLVLHGSIESLLASGVSAPFCRVLSFRVLGANGSFPPGILFAKILEESFAYLAAQGVRVINVSLGDPGAPYQGPRSMPIAAVLDQLIRDHGLVVLISAGNLLPATYAAACVNLAADYPAAILNHVAAGLLEPAGAALATTVGSIVGKQTVSQPGRVPMGGLGWPSPFTRRGPGVMGAVKPEVVAHGGSLAAEAGTFVADSELACLVADGSPSPNLITSLVGTSFAAPLAARVAAAIVARYPTFSSNLVRALLLQGTLPPVDFLPIQPGVGEASRRAMSRQLVGYGEVRLEEAVLSRPNRVVLVAEDTIEVDGIHIYEIPIPARFFEARTRASIAVSLAFDPDTRARRLDYTSSRMKFELVRGLPPAVVERLFAAAPDDLSDAEADDEPDNGEVGSDTNLSSLSQTRRPPLVPSTKARSAGTQQLARRVFGRRLRREDGETFLLVIQNTKRWAPVGSRQPYAVSVALWHDDDQADLYAELAAELQAKAEAQTEVQVELQT